MGKKQQRIKKLSTNKVHISSIRAIQDVITASGYELSLKFTETAEKLIVRKLFAGIKDKQAGLAVIGWLDSLDVLMRVLLGDPLEGINNLNAEALLHRNYEAIALNIQSGILLSCIVSLPSFILYQSSEELFKFLGQPKSIAQQAGEALTIRSYGLFVKLIFSTMQQATRPLSRRTTILMEIINTALTVSLSYALSEGKVGLPKFGVKGIGYGMNLADLFSCVIYILLFSRLMNRVIANSNLSKIPLFNFKLLKQINLRVLFYTYVSGLSMASEKSLSILSDNVLLVMVGWQSSAALGAWAYIENIKMPLYRMMHSVRKASGDLIAHSHTKGEISKAIKYGNATYGISTVLGIVSMYNLFYAAYNYNEDNQNLEFSILLSGMLFWAALSEIPNAIFTISAGPLRGIGQGWYPSKIALNCLLLLALPLSYILGAITNHWAQAANITKGLSLTIGSGLFLKHWSSNSKDKETTIHNVDDNVMQSTVTRAPLLLRK